MMASGGYLQEFLYADPGGPDMAMATAGAAENAATADAAFGAVGEAAYSEAYWATIVATYETEQGAAAAAATVEVPDGAVVLRQGTMLIITPLEHDPEGPPDPLVARLEGLGGEVLVEGDRYGEGSIVVDLSCVAPTEEDAARIAAEIGDYGALIHYAYARPPWVGPPLTEDEALARSTYRQWSSEIADSLVADGTLAEYGQRYLAATSADERARLAAELEEHVAERRLEGLDGDLHPGVAAVLAAAPAGTDPEASVAWGLELGRLTGPLLPDQPDQPPSWFEQRVTASIGAVQAARSSVKVGWTTFTRFAIGMPALLDYLARRECGDVRLSLTDFDDVRGD